MLLVMPTAHRKSLTKLFALAVAPSFVDRVDPIMNDHWNVRARSANAFAVALADDLLATYARWNTEGRRPKGSRR